MFLSAQRLTQQKGYTKVRNRSYKILTFSAENKILQTIYKYSVKCKTVNGRTKMFLPFSHSILFSTYYRTTRPLPLFSITAFSSSILVTVISPGIVCAMAPAARPVSRIFCAESFFVSP